jgi:hypothetical protein
MWTPAPEAQKIAKKYIKDYHTHLASVMIVYIFTDKAFKVHGATADAKVQKISGVNAWLAARDLYHLEEETDAEIEEFILMTIHKESWELYSEAQREALIDHELCHLETNPESGKIEMVSHDTQEFKAVVIRHGLWREDLKSFSEAIQQPALTGLEDAIPGKKGKKSKKGAQNEKVINLIKNNSIKEATPNQPRGN